MQKLRQDKLAVSEVIGALMLTLIVVIAASSFAVYVAEKQKVEQDNQELQDQRKQESIQILFVDFIKNGSAYDYVFTISSNHVGDSEINKMAVNDNIVTSCILNRTNPITGKSYNISMDFLNYTQNLKLDARESVKMILNANDFASKPVSIPNNQAITLTLNTELNNVFQKAFQSPISLITVSNQYLWNSTLGDFSPYWILDGSASQQSGGGYIVSWSWIVKNTDTLVEDTRSGQKARYDFNASANYSIELTVKSNYGMVGVSTIYYHK